MRTQGHSVRALAFHHEKGYEAQRKLALDFAGKDGRIATVEDIVHARLNSNIKDFTWWGTFITGSTLFHGTDSRNRPLLVFAHEGIPPTVAVSDTKASKRWQRQMKESFGDDCIYSRDESPAIEPEEFQKLIDGQYGYVAVVDLSTYKSTAVSMDRVLGDPATGKASNRYSYEEAERDEIARAFFGREFDAFLEHYYSLACEWMKDTESAEMLKTLPLITNRLYSVYDSYPRKERFAPTGYATMHPLTIEGGGLYTNHENKRRVGEIDFSAATNSGIDDLGGPAFFIVGIRGKEPITEITPDFRMVVKEVKEQWPKFVQPLTEVPHDPYVGIKPDGSRERPYYILNRWHTKPEVTGRIMEDGAGSNVPEYRIRKAVRIEGPSSVIFKKGPYNFHEGFPYAGMWDALKAAMPEGANAIACGSSCHSGNTIDASVSYWHIEIDSEPFRILTKCGDSFFSQYNDETKPTHQPHLLVEEATLLDKKLGWRIPNEVYDATFGRREYWPVFSHLITHAPLSANAMWIEKQPVGYQEKAGRNVMHVSVHYYKARFASKAFRPFAELRGDFDWILERRAEAGLLKLAA